MVAVPKSGVLETTTTTGTGAYTLAGATSGYRALVTGDNGLQFHYAVRTATQFEVTIGTYTHSTRQLSRDLVIANHSNNTSPINWGVGTKEVAVVLIAERTAMTDVANVWREQQYFRGNSLWLDADDDTRFHSYADDQMIYYAAGEEFVNFDYANRQLRVVSWDPSANGGPTLALSRLSPSPAVNDAVGSITFAGRDASANFVNYAVIWNQLENVTAGSVTNRLVFQVSRLGAMNNVCSMRGNHITLEPNIDLYTGAKSQRGTNVVGAELWNDGTILGVADGVNPLRLNRKSSDGTIIDVRRDDVSIATVSSASGVVTWGTFCGSHYSDWRTEQDVNAFMERGTVVCATDGALPGFMHLPLIRPSLRAREREVYGVVQAPMEKDDRTLVNVAALGTHPVRVTGPVAIGDLLETSDIPGVAQVQEDDLFRSSTLGKAVQNSPDDGTIRLVPAVLYAG